MSDGFREYIDRIYEEGFTIGEDHDDDPQLIDRHGRAVDTWRENYPYAERLDRAQYDEDKYRLQVELVKFQNWQQRSGQRHLLIFEGREVPAAEVHAAFMAALAFGYANVIPTDEVLLAMAPGAAKP